MAFDGTEGDEITLSEGSAWTENYRDVKASTDPNAHFFGKDLLNELLDQEGCMGIRIYYGINDEEEKVLILVGAKSDEDDLLDLIVDKSAPCPTRCGRNNDLNS